MSSFSENAAIYARDNPPPPPETNNPLAVAPSQEVQDLVVHRDQPQRYVELTPDTGDEQFDAAIRANPSLRQTWVGGENREFTEDFSFGEAIWNGVVRDGITGNTIRVLDQVISELDRSDAHAINIWEAKESLTIGISPEYHADILNAPTMDLAIRESQRIRARELAIKKEYNTHVGKSLAADVVGFVVDPLNLLPGAAVMKGLSVARRTNAIGALKGVAASSKGEKMATLAVAGAFEEAIRMAPRYASDPTFEVNNYMEGIAMGAAFAGFLPVAFSGIKGGILRLPALNDDIQRHLHNWGMDVAVRQAMRFPSKLKETGFKDPGTALRKSKESAQDAVNKKVKEFNKTTEKRKATEAIREDLKGETPSNSRLMQWAESKLDQAEKVAQERLKLKVKRIVQAAVATTVGGVVAGPLGVATAAALFANRDYIAIGAKFALKKKLQRRVAYNAAVAAGDDKAAAAILRGARTKPTLEDAVEEISESISTAVEKAKTKLRDINEKAKVCT